MQRIYKIEIVDGRDPIVQLKASELSVKDLLKDLLNEIKGFQYQIIKYFIEQSKIR